MTQRTLTVDHLRAWVQHCEEQGENTVVGKTMNMTRCLGASTLHYIYATAEAKMESFNTYAWVDREGVPLDAGVSSILNTFDRCQGENELAPVTVAMLRETPVWGMLFPEEERVS